jgi:hypothetical protein
MNQWIAFTALFAAILAQANIMEFWHAMDVPVSLKEVFDED